MLRRIDDKLQAIADRMFQALGYHRHPPPVRLTRIVIVKVPEQASAAPLTIVPAPMRMQPSALMARRR